MSDPIQVERDSKEQHVVVVSLNGPSLNALDEAMLNAVAGAIDEARKLRPRCVVVRSANEKGFCAGANIAAMRGMSKAAAVEFARLGQRTFDAIEALRCPVVAAVHGFALGGGCELALACDFIFAADNARLGQPEVKLGVLPGFGGTQRLARRIGLGRARELIYSGRHVGADEALRIGLANEVWPRAELQERTLERARGIAANGPAAIAAAKWVMNSGSDVDLKTGLELEAQAFGAGFETPEQQEGMGAFLEKRTPAFPDPPTDS